MPRADFEKSRENLRLEQPFGKAEAVLYRDIIWPSQGESLCPQWVPGVVSPTQQQC